MWSRVLTLCEISGSRRRRRLSMRAGGHEELLLVNLSATGMKELCLTNHAWLGTGYGK